MSEKFIKYSRIDALSCIINATSNRQKCGLILALLLMLLTGLTELTLLASLSPLIKILLSDDQFSGFGTNFIESSLLRASNSFSVSIASTLVILFCILIVLATAIRVFTVYYSGRLSAKIGNSFSTRAFSSILKRPFLEIIRIDPSWYSAVITTQSDHVVFVVNQYLELINGAMVSLFIILALLLVDLKISLFLFLVLAISYCAFAMTSKTRLRTNSLALSRNTTLQLKSLNETFESLRYILVNNSQNMSIKKFSEYNALARFSAANTQFLGSFPRYAVEAIGLISILVIINYARASSFNTESLIPTIAVLLLGSQKLLPLFQRIFTAWASVGGYSNSVRNLFLCMQQPRTGLSDVEETINLNDTISSLEFKGISFSYESFDRTVLENSTISFKKGELTGIVGDSGQGKTSLLDIITGLIKPQEGCIIVNDQKLLSFNSKPMPLLNALTKRMTYVPQKTNLANLSILENISGSRNNEPIDFSFLTKCAQIAQIDCFINELPNGYNQIVGEDGIQLSGGQIQRIAIARALYKNADIVVLDEATSALDQATENKLISALKESCKDKIVILVTHHHNAVRLCNRIYRLHEKLISEVRLQPDSAHQ